MSLKLNLLLSLLYIIFLLNAALGINSTDAPQMTIMPYEKTYPVHFALLTDSVPAGQSQLLVADIVDQKLLGSTQEYVANLVCQGYANYQLTGSFNKSLIISPPAQGSAFGTTCELNVSYTYTLGIAKQSSQKFVFEAELVSPVVIIPYPVVVGTKSQAYLSSQNSIGQPFYTKCNISVICGNYLIDTFSTDTFSTIDFVVPREYLKDLCYIQGNVIFTEQEYANYPYLKDAIFINTTTYFYPSSAYSSNGIRNMTLPTSYLNPIEIPLQPISTSPSVVQSPHAKIGFKSPETHTKASTPSIDTLTIKPLVPVCYKNSSVPIYINLNCLGCQNDDMILVTLNISTYAGNYFKYLTFKFLDMRHVIYMASFDNMDTTFDAIADASFFNNTRIATTKFSVTIENIELPASTNSVIGLPVLYNANHTTYGLLPYNFLPKSSQIIYLDSAMAGGILLYSSSYPSEIMIPVLDGSLTLFFFPNQDITYQASFIIKMPYSGYFEMHSYMNSTLTQYNMTCNGLDYNSNKTLFLQGQSLFCDLIVYSPMIHDGYISALFFNATSNGIPLNETSFIGYANITKGEFIDLHKSSVEYFNSSKIFYVQSNNDIHSTVLGQVPQYMTTCIGSSIFHLYSPVEIAYQGFKIPLFINYLYSNINVTNSITANAVLNSTEHHKTIVTPIRISERTTFMLDVSEYNLEGLYSLHLEYDNNFPTPKISNVISIYFNKSTIPPEFEQIVYFKDVFGDNFAYLYGTDKADVYEYTAAEVSHKAVSFYQDGVYVDKKYSIASAINLTLAKESIQSLSTMFTFTPYSNGLYRIFVGSSFTYSKSTLMCNAILSDSLYTHNFSTNINYNVVENRLMGGQMSTCRFEAIINSPMPENPQIFIMVIDEDNIDVSNTITGVKSISVEYTGYSLNNSMFASCRLDEGQFLAPLGFNISMRAVISPLVIKPTIEYSQYPQIGNLTNIIQPTAYLSSFYDVAFLDQPYIALTSIALPFVPPDLEIALNYNLTCGKDTSYRTVHRIYSNAMFITQSFVIDQVNYTGPCTLGLVVEAPMMNSKAYAKPITFAYSAHKCPKTLASIGSVEFGYIRYCSTYCASVKQVDLYRLRPSSSSNLVVVSNNTMSNNYTLYLNRPLVIQTPKVDTKYSLSFILSSDYFYPFEAKVTINRKIENNSFVCVPIDHMKLTSSSQISEDSSLYVYTLTFLVTPYSSLKCSWEMTLSTTDQPLYLLVSMPKDPDLSVRAIDSDEKVNSIKIHDSELSIFEANFDFILMSKNDDTNQSITSKAYFLDDTNSSKKTNNVHSSAPATLKETLTIDVMAPYVQAHDSSEGNFLFLVNDAKHIYSIVGSVSLNIAIQTENEIHTKTYHVMYDKGIKAYIPIPIKQIDEYKSILTTLTYQGELIAAGSLIGVPKPLSDVYGVGSVDIYKTENSFLFASSDDNLTSIYLNSFGNAYENMFAFFVGESILLCPLNFNCTLPIDPDSTIIAYLMVFSSEDAVVKIQNTGDSYSAAIFRPGSFVTSSDVTIRANQTEAVEIVISSSTSSSGSDLASNQLKFVIETSSSSTTQVWSFTQVQSQKMLLPNGINYKNAPEVVSVSNEPFSYGQVYNGSTPFILCQQQNTGNENLVIPQNNIDAIGKLAVHHVESFWPHHIVAYSLSADNQPKLYNETYCNYICNSSSESVTGKFQIYANKAIKSPAYPLNEQTTCYYTIDDITIEKEIGVFPSLYFSSLSLQWLNFNSSMEMTPDPDTLKGISLIYVTPAAYPTISELFMQAMPLNYSMYSIQHNADKKFYGKFKGYSNSPFMSPTSNLVNDSLIYFTGDVDFNMKNISNVSSGFHFYKSNDHRGKGNASDHTDLPKTYIHSKTFKLWWLVLIFCVLALMAIISLLYFIWVKKNEAKETMLV